MCDATSKNRETREERESRRRRRRAHASVCCFERENLKREMNTKVCLSLCVLFFIFSVLA